MSILNIGIQAAALARNAMPDDMEAAVKALRAVAERKEGFREASPDSISSVKVLLTDTARRLKLKGQSVHSC